MLWKVSVRSLGISVCVCFRSVSLRCLSSIAALDSDPGTGSSMQQQRLLQQLFKQILEVIFRDTVAGLTRAHHPAATST